ncbi:MAG: hypothetical protein Q9219_002195 [cf. Caloplaca sp. 3 TL-2023]
MHPSCRPNVFPASKPLSHSFSTTTQCLARSSRSALRQTHRNIPEYPHGSSLLYKQSNFGLYGGVKPQFGNKVSERNEIKTRRKWDPNIQTKRLWSVALNKFIQLKVQARVLRTIDKVGGLDEYLLGESPARIRELGMEGWKMRWRLMQTKGVKERLRKRRIELGMNPEGPEWWLSDKELLGGDLEEVGDVTEEHVKPGNETEEPAGSEDFELSDEEIDRLIMGNGEAKENRMEDQMTNPGSNAPSTSRRL